MMPRGSVKKIDIRLLERATYDCLLDLDLEQEYVKNDFCAKVAIHYGKISKHIIAQNGEPAISRVNQGVSRILKQEGWKTFTKEVAIPGLLTPQGKRVTRGIRHIRWGSKK